MLDHFNLPVSDLRESRAFYMTVLAPLGAALLFEDDDAIGFGRSSWAFGLVRTNAPIQPLHIAFAAGNREVVHQFHRAALKAGAIDNGEPGFRPEYGAGYFAAYVVDRDGHNVEAVCRAGEVCAMAASDSGAE